MTCRGLLNDLFTSYFGELSKMFFYELDCALLNVFLSSRDLSTYEVSEKSKPISWGQNFDFPNEQ